MRYDKKVELIKVGVIEDIYGGVSTESSVVIDTFDCFIAPETIKYMDIDNGQKTKLGTTKIFTKAKINLEDKYILHQNVRQEINDDAFRLKYINNEYKISAITDLGKLTMVEVERNG